MQQYVQGVRALGRRSQHQRRDSLRVDRIDPGAVLDQPAHRPCSARLGCVMQHRASERVAGILWQQRPERGQRVDVIAARGRNGHRQGHRGFGCKGTGIHLQWQLACLQQVRRIGVPGRRGLCEPGSCRRLRRRAIRALQVLPGQRPRVARLWLPRSRRDARARCASSPTPRPARYRVPSRYCARGSPASGSVASRPAASANCLRRSALLAGSSASGAANFDGAAATACTAPSAPSAPMSSVANAAAQAAQSHAVPYFVST